jgi:hypothetical protein
VAELGVLAAGTAASEAAQAAQSDAACEIPPALRGAERHAAAHGLAACRRDRTSSREARIRALGRLLVQRRAERRDVRARVRARTRVSRDRAVAAGVGFAVRESRRLLERRG